MTHAERVREAELAVVDAAVVTYRSARPAGWSLAKQLRAGPQLNAQGRDCAELFVAVHALLVLRAETCPECEGYGVKARIIQRAPDWEEKRVIMSCTSGCDNGRRRA